MWHIMTSLDTHSMQLHVAIYMYTSSHKTDWSISCHVQCNVTHYCTGPILPCIYHATVSLTVKHLQRSRAIQTDLLAGWYQPGVGDHPWFLHHHITSQSLPPYLSFMSLLLTFILGIIKCWKLTTVLCYKINCWC